MVFLSGGAGSSSSASGSSRSGGSCSFTHSVSKPMISRGSEDFGFSFIACYDALYLELKLLLSVRDLRPLQPRALWQFARGFRAFLSRLLPSLASFFSSVALGHA